MATNTPESFLALSAELDGVLCKLCRVDPAVWEDTKMLYSTGNAWSVHTRTTGPKKTRTIHAPSDPLMAMNRGILHQVLRSIPVHSCVHGSHPRTSVITNARTHAGFGKSFYVLDLKDAFPSTTRTRVEKSVGPLIKGVVTDAANLSEDDAQLLVAAIVDLMMVEDFLPQGFPTSPAVLNIVLHPMDAAITQHLSDLQTEGAALYRYTRYVDDLTISCSSDEIDKKVRKKIRGCVVKNGWVPNRSKTMYYGDAEDGDDERTTKMPIVTGLVVHEDGRLTIPRWKLRKWRGFIHSLVTRAKTKHAVLQPIADQMTKLMNEKLEELGETPNAIALFARGAAAPGIQLSDEEHRQLSGIIGFVSMVYDDSLPAIIRKPYLEAKALFKIGNPDKKKDRFPERGVDSP